MTSEICVAVEKFLSQKLGDEIHNVKVEVLNRGTTLHLVTREKKRYRIEIKEEK